MLNDLLMNIIMPVLISPIYFILAFYTSKIKPLRLLIMGEKTYKYGFWIFFLLGIFFLGRPFQILLGAHPFPLIISSVREFIIISLITPCIIIGVLNQIYYDIDIKFFAFSIFSFCIVLGLIFIYFNIETIDGSHLLFSHNVLGITLNAYDGNWFLFNNKNVYILFLIRLISPVILTVFIGLFAIYKSIVFPKDSLYQNLPKKYLLEGISVLIFIFSMIATGVAAYFWKVQTQAYYLGALIAGIIGYISIKIPPRDFIIKNDLNSINK